MHLIVALVIILIVVVILNLILAQLTLPQPIKTVVYLVFALAVLVYLLQVFGVAIPY